MKAIGSLLIAAAGFAAGAGLMTLSPELSSPRAETPRAGEQARDVPADWRPLAIDGGSTPLEERTVSSVPIVVELREPSPRHAPDRAGEQASPEPEAVTTYRPDPSGTTPPVERREPSAAPSPVTIPAGTTLQASLEGPVSSATASAGDPVRARLSEAIVLGGETVLPAGAMLVGIVEQARPAGRVKGNGSLRLRFTRLRLEEGWETALGALWEETAEGKTKRDAAIIGGASAGGALLGQVIGEDTESTVGGAVLGGAIGTGVVLANKGRELELPAGQLLVLQTTAPLEVPLGR